MKLGVPPRDKIAVHPDEAVALIEGQNGHRSLLGLRLGPLLVREPKLRGPMTL